MSSDPDANRFGFLTSKSSQPGLYYRWCLLVLGNNETFTSHSLMPFQFIQNGSYYIPPPIYQQSKSVKQEKPTLVEKRQLVEKEDSESKRRKGLGYGFFSSLICRSNLLLDSVRVGLFDWIYRRSVSVQIVSTRSATSCARLRRSGLPSSVCLRFAWTTLPMRSTSSAVSVTASAETFRISASSKILPSLPNAVIHTVRRRC